MWQVVAKFAPLWLAAHIVLMPLQIAIIGIVGATQATCKPDVHQWLCGSPLEPIARESEYRPDLNIGDEEASASEEEEGALDRVAGAVATLGTLFALLWKVALVVWNIFQFRYSILYDDSFLGIAPIALQIVSWIFAGLAVAGLLAIARGSN